MKISSFLKPFKWVFFVSRRFNLVANRGRDRINSILASLGICFGVMTLITVISVMNGFQMSYIDSIMEVSSYHIRVSGLEEKQQKEFEEECSENAEIRACFPFMEAQALMVGRNAKQEAALIRSVPDNLMNIDEGFKKEAKIWAGDFDLTQDDSIVLGTELARRLGVRVGSTVELFALSGGNDVSLISSDRIFTVKGIIRTGYSDINASYAFIRLEDGKKYLGKNAPVLYGLKLFNTEADTKVIEAEKKLFPEISLESWKSYNRSFFGTLRIEKNMLLLLVLIIFIVVAINIFNGMRRMVFERREEISILTAFGAKKTEIQSVFIMQGFLTGLKGAVPGLFLGLLLSIKMSLIFEIMSKIVYSVQYFLFELFSPENAVYLRENPMYMLYANIPPRIFVNEVFLITVFGIFASLLASWCASRSVLKLTVAEVMRDE